MGGQYTKISFEQMKSLCSRFSSYAEQWNNEIRLFEKNASVLCESWEGKAGSTFRNELPEIIEGYENIGAVLKEYAAFLNASVQKYEEAELSAQNIVSRL